MTALADNPAGLPSASGRCASQVDRTRGPGIVLVVIRHV